MSASQQNSDITVGPNQANLKDYYYEEAPNPFYHIEDHWSPLRRTRSTQGRVEGHGLLDRKPHENLEVVSNSRRSTKHHEIPPAMNQIPQLVGLADRDTLQPVQIKNLYLPQRSQPIMANENTLQSTKIASSSKLPEAQHLIQRGRLPFLGSSQHSTQPQSDPDAIRSWPGMYESNSIGMFRLNQSSSSVRGTFPFQSPQNQLINPTFGLSRPAQCQGSSSSNRVDYEHDTQRLQSTRTALHGYDPGRISMSPSIRPADQNNSRSYDNLSPIVPGINGHSRRMMTNTSEQKLCRPSSTVISLLYGPALQEGCPIVAAREVRIALDILHKYFPSQAMRDLAYEIFRKHLPMEREWTKGAISQLETEAFCQWGSRDDLSAPPAPQYWAQRVMQQVLIREWPYWYFDAELAEKEQYKGHTRKFADSLKTFRLHCEQRQIAKLECTLDKQDKDNNTKAPETYVGESRNHREREPRGIQAMEHPASTEISFVGQVETVGGQERQVEESPSSNESQMKRDSSSPEESETRATTPVTESHMANSSLLEQMTKDRWTDFLQQNDVNAFLEDSQPMREMSPLLAQRHENLLEGLTYARQPLVENPDIRASMLEDLLNRADLPEAEQVAPRESGHVPEDLLADTQGFSQGSSATEEAEKTLSMHEDQQHVLEPVEDQEQGEGQGNPDLSAELRETPEQLSPKAAMHISAALEQSDSGPSEDKHKRKQGKKGKRSQWRRLAVDYPLPPTPL